MKMFAGYVCNLLFIAGVLYITCSVSVAFADSTTSSEEKEKGEEQGTVSGIEGQEGTEEAASANGTETSTTSVSVKKFPISKEAIDHFNLGVSYQKQGYTEGAIKEYNEALKIDPDNADANNNLGVIYKEKGNLDEAVKRLHLALSVYPEMDEAHNNLGTIYYLRGKIRAAKLEYQKALKSNPNNLASLINMGNIYKAQNQTRRAIDTFEEALVVEPTQPEAHYNLAALFDDLGHREAAIWHYNRFITFAGKSYPELAGKVDVYIKHLKVAKGEAATGDVLEFTGKDKVIEVEKGQTFGLTLAANFTTGYSWNFAEEPDEQILKVVEETWSRNESSEKIVGAPGKQHWTIDAVGKGRTTILLNYVRPWEKDKPPAEIHKVEVSVR